MNIFAKILFTQNRNIQKIFIQNFWLQQINTSWEVEVFEREADEEKIILLFSNDPSKWVQYAKENYEIISFFSLGIAYPFDNLDIKMWDIIIPNTILSEKNEVFFLENNTERNYEMEDFWLLLNGITVSLNHEISSGEELQELRESLGAETFDHESYDLAKLLDENNLLEKSVFVKMIGSDDETITHGVEVIEMML